MSAGRGYRVRMLSVLFFKLHARAVRLSGRGV